MYVWNTIVYGRKHNWQEGERESLEGKWMETGLEIPWLVWGRPEDLVGSWRKKHTQHRGESHTEHPEVGEHGGACEREDWGVSEE